LSQEGKHNWQKRPDGTSIASDRVEAGSNPFLSLTKGKVPCYDKNGNHIIIPKEIYYSQTGPIEDREYVFNNSNEGSRRKLLKTS
jgi:hypothetical protein